MDRAAETSAVFSGDLGTSTEEPIPNAAIDEVDGILLGARLFRYHDSPDGASETRLLEQDLAEALGVRYALAVNAGTSAIYLALVCSGIGDGDDVLIPALTFTAVPSAVVHAGARPVLVECRDDFSLDPDDLERCLTPATRALLVSHMRGRVTDMELVVAFCERHGLDLIEDCAHSLGVTYDGRPMGTFGRAGCFSFQSHKIINAGEGGALVTNDEDLMARAIVHGGAYEEFANCHGVPPDSLAAHQTRLPLLNMRMSNVTAAIARRQLPFVAERAARYRALREDLAGYLADCRQLTMPADDPRVSYAPDTVQLKLVGLGERQVRRFCELARADGVPVRVFGLDPGNARCFWNWRYLPERQELPRTRTVLCSVADITLPLWLTDDDLRRMAEILAGAVERATAADDRSAAASTVS